MARAPARPGSRILGRGTGMAVISVWLTPAVEAAGRVVGLDLPVAVAMLACGRRHVEGAAGSTCIRLVRCSAMVLPFTGGLFDGVACGLGTHHMDRPCIPAGA